MLGVSVPPCIATSPRVCRSRGDCRCGAGVGADPVLPVVASIATARRMKADGHRQGHRLVSRGQPCNAAPVLVPVPHRGHRCLIAIAHGPSSGAEWPPSWHGLGPLHMSSKPSSVAKDYPARAAQNVQWVCPRYPNCGQDAATFETGPRVSGERCARGSAHNRRHAAGDSHSARSGPSLRNVRRSIRTCLADHHLVGRQRDDGS
jgi:hypothetical protein